MSLPWFPFKTMDPVKSISKSGWRTQPPDWVMRAEFAALLASNQIDNWTLRELAVRWCVNRKRAKRIVQQWLDDTENQVWPEEYIDIVKAAHKWIAPECPTDVPEDSKSSPTEDEESQGDTDQTSPEVPQDVPKTSPLLGASPIGEKEEEEDLSVPALDEKRSPAAEVFSFWKSWHPAARKLSAGDQTKINGRLRDSSLDDVRLVIRWAHEAGDADWFQGENPRGKKYLGLGTLLKAENYSDRLGNALAWQERGYQDLSPVVDAKAEARLMLSRLKDYAERYGPDGSQNEPLHLDERVVERMRRATGAAGGWKKFHGELHPIDARLRDEAFTEYWINIEALDSMGQRGTT